MDIKQNCSDCGKVPNLAQKKYRSWNSFPAMYPFWKMKLAGKAAIFKMADVWFVLTTLKIHEHYIITDIDMKSG